MSVEFIAKMHLDKFKPRPYQQELFDKVGRDNVKKAVLCWHRRAGKDLCCFNLMILKAIERVGDYLYILPTYRQAKLTVWGGATNEGVRFLDYIPKELIKQINISDMRITLVNGSQIIFVGSEDPDKLRGNNAIGIVFSEYAFQNDCYPVLRPILAANDGWCIFVSTPNGMNHFHKLFHVASQSKDWYCDLKTVDDTRIVTQDTIDEDIRLGLISPDMANQEFHCSFSAGAEGSYYSQYLNRMELNGQVGNVPYEPAFPVFTAWDLGCSDATVILFFQVIAKSVHIIDLHANTNKGLEYYASLMNEKPYNYSKHFCPHDGFSREKISGGTYYDKAKQLGIKFESKMDSRNVRQSVIPNVSLLDGIEKVRSSLPKIWIDENRCKELIAALRDYRRKYDPIRKVYHQKPLHDKHSDYADALRYLCLALSKCTQGTSAEDIERNYREALLGDDAHLPPIFQKRNRKF